MKAVGSFMLAAPLKDCAVLELDWFYDGLDEAWYVRHRETGRMLAYITREMVLNTIFTPESLLLNWFYCVASRCEGGPVYKNQLVMRSEQK